MQLSEKCIELEISHKELRIKVIGMFPLCEVYRFTIISLSCVTVLKS